MKIITAPDLYLPKREEVSVFLAGGITGCPVWQEEVIRILRGYHDVDDLVVYNPRRSNFDVTDKFATETQITWERMYLCKCNIFSMYFADSETNVQPICMYELGMMFSYTKRIIVSVERGYAREQDVIIQTKLATNDNIKVNTNASPETHAKKIYEVYQNVKDRGPFYSSNRKCNNYHNYYGERGDF